MKKSQDADGMEALRSMFLSGTADAMNFVLFSTGGVHGTYGTIEDAEMFLFGQGADGNNEVTFLVVHPRIVSLRYGVCRPVSRADIDWLKNLRASSFIAAASIGV